MRIKKILNIFTHRAFLVALSLTIQLSVLVLMIVNSQNYFVYFYVISIFVSLIVYIYIINSKTNPNYKIAWISIILLFPIFGGLLYIFLKGDHFSERERKKLMLLNQKKIDNLPNNVKLLNRLTENNIDAANQSRYISDYGHGPLYSNTKTEYFKVGEEFFPTYLNELKKASQFIFLEYYIIAAGKMWNSILEILKEKAASGVDVRIIYDDMGCIVTLPANYFEELESYGIKCCVFNPFVPVLTTSLNNRDHRKMTIIDGHTVFTGGVNLADEYINEMIKYGYWKDNAIMLKGEAVWSFTVMFLSMWEYLSGYNEDYENYKFIPSRLNLTSIYGYVQPYDDSPLDDETTGINVYLNLINKAKCKVYLMTPYLIIDEEMVNALCLAAKSGIDVRIITPGIPDKKIVNELTKAYYRVLLESGVRIFEYAKGFVHSKLFLVDDMYATVGTFNVDYRSLYLHFECGIWLYETRSIGNIIDDFNETFLETEEIKLETVKKAPLYKRFLRAILRIFATLM